MMLGVLIFVGFCASSVVSDQAIQLPAGLKTCKKDSSDYSSCLRLALQESWPIIVQGIPELNLPSLDPQFTESMTNDFEFGAVTGRIIVRNANTYGASKVRFLSVRVLHNNDQHRLEVDVDIPKIFIEGDFKADAAFGTFKIGGKGQFNISMENVRGTMEIDGKVKDDRWVIESYNFQPEVGTMKIWADDLFNGNPELTKAALDFANEYWQILYTGMLPYAAKTWNAMMRDRLNDVLSKVSFSSLFP
ncbi:hypothetical protein PV327_000434 [Microctonus hyperodae]|uniref:Circadian clock-controlled protein n=1 Tax=Microctonus hyperodae TaxID=165561 RepID=A0AA39G799_MICHY|nr:hypothetical protein PV327_000434 [Microctonus hyperodae]